MCDDIWRYPFGHRQQTLLIVVTLRSAAMFSLITRESAIIMYLTGRRFYMQARTYLSHQMHKCVLRVLRTTNETISRAKKFYAINTCFDSSRFSNSFDSFPFLHRSHEFTCSLSFHLLFYLLLVANFSCPFTFFFFHSFVFDKQTFHV